ncbi:VapA/VapB family virulence-associated protein [Xenorhabdus stockiae]|uniref:VapA/VapB family virulence-associated protein n=1 Tax=Xenorhabdus stockiae TaxID=351614 RepID=UPI004064A464
MNAIKDNGIRSEIIEEFRKQAEGKWEPELIDKTVKEMTSLEIQGCAALLTVKSFIIRQHFKVALVDYKEVFDGDSWGLSSASIGSSAGIVFTSNLDKLFSDTTNFWFFGAGDYLTMSFYSEDGSFLGTFQGAALSMIVGGGYGSGNWS